MGYMERVDQIYALGAAGQTGFVGDNYYMAYGTWRERALEIDAGTAFPGDQWNVFLSADLDNGLLDYNKGYVPLYNLFVLGQVGTGVPPGPGPGPGPIPPGGIRDLLKNPLILAGAAVVVILLLKK